METLEMLACQADKFKLDSHITYLNGAYMSPSLKSVEDAGHQAISQKSKPYEIKPDDFFKHSKRLRELFAALVDIPDFHNTAIIPSASYGMATVANNISLQAGDEIVLIEEQFPSNVYIWQKLAKQFDAKIVTVKAPKIEPGRAHSWNQRLLDHINPNTAVVAIPPAHWADGTLYDLKAVREKTRQHDALMIIDGSQFIGAAPFSVREIEPDALITVAYKWLLGPYSMGMAYYSDRFNEGMPIEESWINRHNSEDFSGLVSYEDRYQPKAGRYNMGEYSNFINTPMLIKSLEQLLEWTPKAIEHYCDTISKSSIEALLDKGCYIEAATFRTKHLFGVYLPQTIDLDKLKTSFSTNNVFVSFRGNAIRISPNVYNKEEDFERLLECF